MYGIGLMSGSSMDGLDLVYTKFEHDPKLTWKIIHSSEVELGQHLVRKLAVLADAKPLEIACTESEYSKFLASALNTFIRDNKLTPDFIAIHGHTLLHLPEHHVSWQIVNGGMISSLTNVTTICDFRNQDMAMGGQGTPMAVLADRNLFPSYDYYINLGGIANISIAGNSWKAFDLCPCNQVLNFLAQRMGKSFDNNGDMARTGTVNNTMVSSLLNENYFQLKGPKSLDNNWIKNYWIPKILSFNETDVNCLRSYVSFMCACINKEIDKTSAKLLISGGGAHNTFLIEEIISTLKQSGTIVQLPSQEIINFKEALLIAYAGYLRILNKPNFISEATGAQVDTIGGAIYLPPEHKLKF